MPFKSRSQKIKFAELVKEGKVSKKTFDEWNSATSAKLPERITAPKSPRSTEDLVKIRQKKFGK